MSMSLPQPPRPRTDHLITEDGEPVESILAEKHYRLLTAPLYASWKPGRTFLVAANVGVFVENKNPAIVPDVFVSLDVEVLPFSGPDRINSYFVWEYGKPPDIVIEIVSDAAGGELSDKLRKYERMRVPHYVVFDPHRRLGSAELTTFSLDGGAYTMRAEPRYVAEGLALTLWDGTFEGSHGRWLRWTDLDGRLFPTGAESEARAAEESARADVEKARGDAAAERAEVLLAKLRALGVDPDEG